MSRGKAEIPQDSVGITTLQFVHCRRCKGPLGFLRLKPADYRPVFVANLAIDPDCAVARIARQVNVPVFTVIDDGRPPVQIYPSPATEIDDPMVMMLARHVCEERSAP